MCISGDAAMNHKPAQITLEQWDRLYESLQQLSCMRSCYDGPLGRHLKDGDLRLAKLKFDNSTASLRLWNFLLTEEQRLHQARAEGKKIIGAMKDLGTVPVMVYSLDNSLAFYPDGAWWLPCIKENKTDLLKVADSFGIDESFCPVRAMLGAFVTKRHFPVPDMLICSVGATCDDFSVIAQMLENLGHRILWWEIPHRRYPEPDEDSVFLPGGFSAPKSQVHFVQSQLQRVKASLEGLTNQKLNDKKLSAGIKKANKVRGLLDELRYLVFTAPLCPLPALEMLVTEMLAIHFCSDRSETIIVLEQLIDEVQRRIKADAGFGKIDAARIFWVNPVADLQVMNLLEDCSGRLCGTEFLFSHALDIIPENLPPMEALAQVALADPMVGSVADRAERICRDIQKFGAEAVLISRIPGASHCALEGLIISEIVRSKLDIPTAEIEVSPLTDSFQPTLRTRITALVETVKDRRRK
jgi:benzoyl-CoA reductase/2-hydroxyglutaryl-CoA dehydratase subunit BcrC/BadD/HgdB